MAYDLMGNYTGYDDTQDYETEEQRRRRLAAEQANAVVHTTQVKTYGDGTQEETTKRTIAGPIAPDQTAAETARLSRQNAQPGYGVQDYLNYVRQNESSNNYNIGYHYAPNAQGQRASTAYGAYGITGPAYQDIQAADPYFQGRDITSLTPEDQDRAAQTYRQVQMRQMAARGMEPTEENLRGAQYAGVGGLNQYQQRGTLAPGVNEQTLQARMAGGGAPASGAAQRPLPPNIVREPDGTLRMTSMPQQPPAEEPSPYALTAPGGQGLQVPGVPATPQPAVDPYIKAYQDSQDDITKLLPIAQDPNAPEFIRQRASERAAEINMNRRMEQQAKAQVANLDPKDLPRVLASKEGSWVKAILYGILGMENSQKEEAYKLGIGRWETAQITGPEGESINVEIKRAPNGKILEGTRLDGTPLTSAEMAEMSVGGKTTKPTVSTQDVEKGDLRGRVVTENLPNGRTKTYVESGGKRYAYDASWKPVSISTAAAKAEAGQQITLKYAEAIQAAKGSGETKGKLTEYGINVLTTPDGQTVLEQNGQILRPDAAGNISVSTPAGRATSLAQLRSGEKLGLERGQGVIKAMDEEIRPQAQAGDTVSSVRKQQFAIFDRPGIDSAKLFGIATGSGQSPGDQKWTMLRDIFAGAVASNADGSPMNGQQLSQRLYGLNLTPAELSAIAEYNIANQKINAATLKQTAGPGSVSNAEQQANRESNVDITKIPALGAYNAMAQSQFDGDRARYKADWAAGKDFKTALELDKAWRKESQMLADMYAERAKERIKWINANGNTPNAVKEGYKLFPVPEYDPATETWKKRQPLGSFNR